MRMRRLTFKALISFIAYASFTVSVTLGAAISAAGQSNSVAKHNESNVVMAEMVEAVHGGPIRFDQPELNRFAGDLREHFVDNGELIEYSADPNKIGSVSQYFNIPVFKDSSICDECGALDPGFRSILENPSVADDIRADVKEAPSVLGQTVGIFWRSLLVFNVMATLILMLAYRVDAHANGYKFRDIRWNGLERWEWVVKWGFPLYYFIIYPLFRKGHKKFNEALRDLNLFDPYNNAVQLLKTMKKSSFNSNEDIRRREKLEELVERVNIAVAQYNPELESHDKTNAALRKRVDELVDDLSLQVDARDAAMKEVSKL